MLRVFNNRTHMQDLEKICTVFSVVENSDKVLKFSFLFSSDIMAKAASVENIFELVNSNKMIV